MPLASGWSGRPHRSRPGRTVGAAEEWRNRAFVCELPTRGRDGLQAGLVRVPGNAFPILELRLPWASAGRAGSCSPSDPRRPCVRSAAASQRAGPSPQAAAANSSCFTLLVTSVTNLMASWRSWVWMIPRSTKSDPSTVR
jgi:hypothetical protein